MRSLSDAKDHRIWRKIASIIAVSPTLLGVYFSDSFIGSFAAGLLLVVLFHVFLRLCRHLLFLLHCDPAKLKWLDIVSFSGRP
jgi:hypothetical protein